MDNGISTSIQTRRDALYQHYDLPPEARQKAESLFTRMEQFGEECKDQAEFESKFSTLTMNREYNNLFVEFTAYVKKPDNVPGEAEYARMVAAGAAQSVIERKMETGIRQAAFHAMPDEMRSWSVYGIYKVPVLGPIVSSLNLLGSLQRFFQKRKKKKKTEEDENRQ